MEKSKLITASGFAIVPKGEDNILLAQAVIGGNNVYANIWQGNLILSSGEEIKAIKHNLKPGTPIFFRLYCNAGIANVPSGAALLEITPIDIGSKVHVTINGLPLATGKDQEFTSCEFGDEVLNTKILPGNQWFGHEQIKEGFESMKPKKKAAKKKSKKEEEKAENPPESEEKATVEATE